MASTLALQARPVNRVHAPKDLQIHLSENETRLCDLLNECTAHLRNDKNVDTTCRIAGGWVRDKLLGRESHDIDIALSDIMGLAFANHLAEFANAKGIPTGTIAKIAQNPDQSKHLETATLKLYGLDIDLVNLRSEEYAEDSRIPTEVSFGTPLEDAMRRDITINALFYNVHTRMVEDFTGKGLEDIRTGLIRTPLPPLVTFRDDPLRVLRCIRFASRFGFHVVSELSDAAKNPGIQEALVSKVKRERVGVEIDKMLQGPDPLRSLQMINDHSLYQSMCSALPSDVLATLSGSPQRSDKGLRAATILNLLVDRPDDQLPKVHPYFLKALQNDLSARPRLYLASFLTPYLGITYTNPKNKTLPAVEVVVREALKLGSQNHYLDGIPPLFEAIPRITKLLDQYAEVPSPTQRSFIGSFLREKGIHHSNSGVHWSTTFLFMLVVEISNIYDIAKDSLDVESAAKEIDRLNRFAAIVEQLDLYDVGEMKPLLNGREVGEALDAKSSGPWLATTLYKVVDWQLDNPQLSKEDAILWLRAEREAGRIEVPTQSGEPLSKRKRTK